MTMHDLAELKEFVVLHTRAQGLPPGLSRRVLSRIEVDSSGPGSWAYEWTRAGDERLAKGRPLEACKLYNLARFPFVDGGARAAALAKCVRAFEAWARRAPLPIQRVAFDVGGREVVLYLSNPGQDRRGLILVMGGIVSLKEQWHPFLVGGARLGCTVAVVDFPGVGENRVTYDERAHAMIGAVLDALAPVAPVATTYGVGMSFGGHLLLARALRDPRLRGLATVGAPIHDFFQDAGWWEKVPRVTKRTLAHVCGASAEGLFGALGRLALAHDSLARLDLPIVYVASARDEIIPATDWELLACAARDVRLIVLDDCHGSPNHLGRIKKEIPLWLLQQMGRPRSLAAVLCRIAIAIEKRKPWRQEKPKRIA